MSLLFFFLSSQAQVEIEDTLKTTTGNIYGTLMIPVTKQKIPVVLIIAGSGPTDRNGNSSMSTNNSLKMLADSLYEHGIASLRYDKRAIAASKAAIKKEDDLRFENYVDDAAGWIEQVKKDARFSKVIVAGHSEGSLIGMIAARKAGADGYISIAGAGRSADLILKEQIATHSPTASSTVNPMIDTLKSGQLLKKVDPSLNMLFRPSVQPYLISWFKYDPQVEIAKLTIPVLILQGNTDIQVDTTDAIQLAKANKRAELKIIKGMNHILKESEMDMQKNVATYTNPDLPLKKELVYDMVTFINTK
jgi:uncharacterized protein